MHLKRTFKRMLAGICLSIVSCSPPVVYKSTWQSTPVTIDGKATEWQIPLEFYDAKTKLNFSISNDMTSLNICIRVTDETAQMGILRAGMQLWIDTTCKKNRTAGIQFPIVQREQGSSSGHSSKQQGNQEANSGAQPAGSSYDNMPDTGKTNRMHRHFNSSPKQMRVKGLLNIPDGLVELPGIYSVNVSLDWDNSGAMIYEASIPLNTIYKKTFMASDSDKVLGISFNITTTPKRTSGGGGGHGGGMHGGGGGMGMHGGGMGGSHEGGGNEGGNESSPEVQTVWVEFRLATK